MKEVTLDNGSVYGFDFLVSSLNSEGLSKVMPGVSVDIPHANWSVLNLGYENRPKLEGFGYAVPGIENSKIFAVIFNYNCFKENKATVTVLGRGEYDEMIKELLIQTGLPYPSTGIGRILHSGSSIYSLGHYHNFSKLQNLPDWLSVIGHSFHHSGIPSCIIRSDESITRITSKNP
jgi:protoporphyrinogen oxidase